MFIKIDLKNFMKPKRRLVIESHHIFSKPEVIEYNIPDGLDEFGFDFKDESIPECLPDEDGNIWSDICDGRIYYYFKVYSGKNKFIEIDPLPY